MYLVLLWGLEENLIEQVMHPGIGLDSNLERLDRCNVSRLVIVPATDVLDMVANQVLVELTIGREPSVVTLHGGCVE